METFTLPLPITSQYGNTNTNCKPGIYYEYIHRHLNKLNELQLQSRY